MICFQGQKIGKTQMKRQTRKEHTCCSEVGSSYPPSPTQPGLETPYRTTSFHTFSCPLCVLGPWHHVDPGFNRLYQPSRNRAPKSSSPQASGRSLGLAEAKACSPTLALSLKQGSNQVIRHRTGLQANKEAQPRMKDNEERKTSSVPRTQS